MCPVEEIFVCSAMFVTVAIAIFRMKGKWQSLFILLPMPFALETIDAMAGVHENYNALDRFTEVIRSLCLDIEPKFLVYYILIFIAAVLGMIFFKRKRNLQPLFMLLPLSLLNELIVELLICQKINFYPVYHVYEIADCFFLCLLFHRNRQQSNLKNVPVIFFAGFLLLISGTYLVNPSVTQYPSTQYSIESVTLITLGILFLWNIEPTPDIRLSQMGMFWIASGVILSHSGIFIINGSFNYLIKASEKTNELKNWMNMIFNYILYIFIIIGILCQKSSKK